MGVEGRRAGLHAPRVLRFKKKKKKVCCDERGRNEKTIGEESQTDRSEASSPEQCAQVHTKYGSVPGVSACACGCEG